MNLPTGNRIIDAVSDDPTAAFILEAAEIVTLERQQFTTMSKTRMTYVDHPLTSLMSVVASLEDGSGAEIASIGNEGFVEIDAALHDDHAKRTSLCLLPGLAIRLPIHIFKRGLNECESFADAVYHAVRTRAFISEQMVLCSLRHSAAERLARWLLLAVDRTNLSELSQTHDQLAASLGIRRASVSVEAAALQATGAIQYHRGLVMINDRQALVERACECYALCHEALQEYAPHART